MTPTNQKGGPRLDRRAMLGAASVATIGAVLGASGSAQAAAATGLTDGDIFNFALNLEYLEANLYLHAVTGQGLPSTMTTGTGTPGTVTLLTPGPVPFQSTAIQQYALRLALDEQAHVNLIRQYLTVKGFQPVAQPAINYAAAFTALAVSANLIQPGQTFDPLADDVSFLLAAYSLIDVGVSAYAGAANMIVDPDLQAQAAGLLGAEGSHSGAIRGILADLGGGNATNAISAARAALSGAADDVGTSIPGEAYNFIDNDYNGLVFRRTPQQVLAIAYQTAKVGTIGGGFFPNGVNGTISAV